MVAMQLKDQIFLLEIYGIIKIFLGVWQIVAMMGGYFLLEWVVNYQGISLPYFMDRDLLLLAYLAIFFRGVFHTIVGIGVARSKLWANGWLVYGWPVMCLMTTGLVFSLFHYWQGQGAVSSLAEFISWPKLFLYGGFVFFDLIWIKKAILTVNQNQAKPGEGAESIDAKNISIILAMAVVSISIVLFFAKPISKGFHRGFYKVKGELSKDRKPIAALESQKYVAEKDLSVSAQAIEKIEDKLPLLEPEADGILTKVVKPSVVASDQDMGQGAVREEEVVKKRKFKGGLSYQKIIGWAGGWLVVMAFLIRLIEPLGQRQNMEVIFFGLLAAGFFLWGVYGISIKESSLWLTSFISCGLSIFLLLKICEGRGS